MVDASGLLRVVSEASDAIAIGRVGNLVRINGANPDTGPALCAAITAIEVQGGTGPNVIDVKAVTAAAFTALTDVGIDGGGGADTLTGPSGPQTWTLLSRDAGTIAGSTPSPSFHFTAIEDLVGGGGNNRFVLTDGGTLTGSITGGSVPATLDYGDVTADIQVALSTSGPNGFDGTATGLGGGFRGIDTLVSGTGYDRLIGEAPGGVWRLAAPSTYADGTSTLTFSGFKSIEGGAGPNQFDLLGDAQGNLTADLHGGAGANVFRFHGAVILTGTITGSPGSNTISYADFGSSVSVALTGSTADGESGTELSSISGGFRGIDNLIGTTPDHGPDILTGENVDSLWSLGPSPSYRGSGGVLAFSSFEVLQGGSGVDHFDISGRFVGNLHGGPGDDVFQFGGAGAFLVGGIDGGSGVNTIDMSLNTLPVRIDLTNGTTTGASGPITGIEIARGGRGNDTLIAGPLDSTLVGGEGDNVLIDGPGDNLLFGGAGNDRYVLAARGAHDIVVDSGGVNTLDFSRASAAITIDLDSAAQQPIAGGGSLTVHGTVQDVVGSSFSDRFLVRASAVPHRIDGGLPATLPGDTLVYDARGLRILRGAGTLTPDGLATVTYVNVETVEILNASSVQVEADLAIAQRVTPDSPTADGDLVFTLTVTNLGPYAASGVLVTDDVPAGLSVVSVSPPRVAVTGSDQRLSVSLGMLTSGAVATITIVARPRRAGFYTNAATVASTGSVDPDASNNTAIRSFTVPAQVPPSPPPDSTPPYLVSLLRFGVHAAPTRLVFTFSEQLDPSRAVDLANYRVTAPGPDGRFGTRDDRPIRLLAAYYDAATFSVTLLPARRLNWHLRFLIIVNGSTATGITDLAGNLLDGNGDGKPGGDVVAILQHFVATQLPLKHPAPQESPAKLLTAGLHHLQTSLIDSSWLVPGVPRGNTPPRLGPGGHPRNIAHQAPPEAHPSPGSHPFGLSWSRVTDASAAVTPISRPRRFSMISLHLR